MIDNGIQIGCQTGCESALYVITAISLLTFGLCYNLTVGWLEDNGYDQGYTSFLVVIGILITLILIIPIIGLTTFAILTFAFTFSGLPMIIGHIWRHVRERQRSAIEFRKFLEADANQDSEEFA